MKVGVLAPESSWHYRDLSRAARSIAGCEIVSIDFTKLAATIDSKFGERFLDESSMLHSLGALVVRTMPYGSLQQVVFRMDLLHRMVAAGVPVINSPRSVEIAIDKYLSLCLMSEAGIAVPRFAVCQTVEQGLEVFEDLGRDVVLKPIFGSMGKRVFRFTNADRLKKQMERFAIAGEVLYLQRFVDHSGGDIRIFIAGDSVFSMRRENRDGSWLTNVSQGATAVPYSATATEIDLARKAAATNQCQIAGVDIVYEKGSSQPLVLEVNASPGWEAIQSVSGHDVGARVLQTILDSANRKA